ncbi:hypothetical protein TRFO_18490 [Tritrichomonas foetus]|uniref:Sec23/Sec24 trunk domain-containing protein n=1 Tax=Tritrichomonas foetus TaxID=1144522 RepID=A0A1J4KL95_9EUKA|nr:hypothetical protein TRFO_18490 [Tritrichomonas foetus]|eukprot:OHT11906.1 hypothetical protein TRFO_18490 [Tritrichomonas foetus]
MCSKQDCVFPWGNKNMIKDFDPDHFQDPSNFFRPFFKICPSNKLLNNKIDPSMNFINSSSVSVFPAAETSLPTIEYENTVFCSGCDSVVSNKCEINENQKQWKCHFCGKINDIQCEIDEFKKKPEFNYPFYEIIVPKGQFLSKPQRQFFIIDVSFPAVAKGYTYEFINAILDAINIMPSYYEIGICTMSNKVHVYNMRTGELEEFFEKDLQESYPSGEYLNRIENCKPLIFSMLDKISQIIPDESINGHCICTALNIVNSVLNNEGIVNIFCVGLPTFGDYPLSDRRLPESDSTLLNIPSTEVGTFYKDGKTLFYQLVIHLFVGGDSLYCDVATMGKLINYGEVKYYGRLTEETKRQIRFDVKNILNRPFLWHTNFNIHASEGTLISDEEDNIFFAAIKPQFFYVFEFFNEASLETINFQFTLDYQVGIDTKVIRVLNYTLPVTNDYHLLFKSIDEPCSFSYYLSSVVNTYFSRGSKISMQLLFDRIIMLRKIITPSFLHILYPIFSQKIFAESPKSEIDKKAAFLYSIFFGSRLNMILSLYPRLICIDTGFKTLPLTKKSLKNGSIFAIHKPNQFFIMVRKNITKISLNSYFGVTDIKKLTFAIPKLETKENKEIWELYKKTAEMNQGPLLFELFVEGSRNDITDDLYVEDMHSTVTNAPCDVWIDEVLYRMSIRHCI